MSAQASAASIFTAQNLNSGIFPYGSRAGLVSMFAAASAKQNGTKTMLCGTAPSARADIYKLVDDQGVVHLSDRPMGPGSVLILRGRNGARSGRPARS